MNSPIAVAAGPILAGATNAYDCRQEHPMTLLDKLSAEPAPLRTDEGGILRIGQTRVRLDSVITAFKSGSSAEEILLKFPSLQLKHIYGVLAYYLWHQDEVDAYLRGREDAALAARREAEAKFPRAGVRGRLLNRRSSVCKP